MRRRAVLSESDQAMALERSLRDPRWSAPATQLEIAMTDWKAPVHDPESCLCPRCGRVMQLSRVPALRSLETRELFLRCNGCEYISMELQEISSPELVCDIHNRASEPTASDLVDQAIARLVREAGADNRRRALPMT